jgi:RNA polymerase sigma-70 factor, ECF subfamily
MSLPARTDVVWGAPAGSAARAPRSITLAVTMHAPRDAAEQTAFAAQALACADGLYNLARYLAAKGGDAEDLVQETYARAFAAADRFEGGDLKAWLFRILRNTFLSRVRHDRVVPMVGGLDTVEPDAGDAPDDAWLRGDFELEAMRRLVGAEIESALLALSVDARTAILLDLEGFREAEMAEILGCAPGTVKSRLARARAALRTRLAEYAR